jgi:hypothetical protein
LQPHIKMPVAARIAAEWRTFESMNTFLCIRQSAGNYSDTAKVAFEEFRRSLSRPARPPPAAISTSHPNRQVTLLAGAGNRDV